MAVWITGLILIVHGYVEVLVKNCIVYKLLHRSLKSDNGPSTSLCLFTVYILIIKCIYIIYTLSFLITIPFALKIIGYYLLMSFYALYGGLTSIGYIKYIYSHKLYLNSIEIIDKSPSVSVVVHVDDLRPRDLLSSINSVLMQDYNGNITVYCVFENIEINAAYLHILKEFEIEFKQKHVEYGIVNLIVNNCKRSLVICKRTTMELDLLNYTLELINSIDNPDYLVFMTSNMTLNRHCIHNFIANFINNRNKVLLYGIIANSKQIGLLYNKVENQIITSTFKGDIRESTSANNLYAVNYHNYVVYQERNNGKSFVNYAVEQYGYSTVGLCGLSYCQLINTIKFDYFSYDFEWLNNFNQFSLLSKIYLLAKNSLIMPLLPILLIIINNKSMGTVECLFWLPLFSHCLFILFCTFKYQLWSLSCWYLVQFIFDPFIQLVILIKCCLKPKKKFPKRKHNHVPAMNKRPFSDCLTEFTLNESLQRPKLYTNDRHDNSFNQLKSSHIISKRQCSEVRLEALIVLPKTSQFNLNTVQ